MIRSRIAPTPSGFLHLGNAVNFLLVWVMVRARGGALKLRIDDADAARTRPEYVEDIFRQLEWLGITWDEGPQSPDEFYRRHSQLLRVDRYHQTVELLRQEGHVFACTCSRSLLRSAGSSVYPGTCRGRAAPPGEEFALRLQVPEETVVRVQDTVVPLGRRMGDFVVWRRDDAPAYQLASVVDDIDGRINLIVRGEDLLESTAAQLFLAAKLKDAGSFLDAAFYHHPLVADAGGRKLSKSQNAHSLAAFRSGGGSAAQVYQAAAAMLGLHRAGVCHASELLDAYRDRE